MELSSHLTSHDHVLNIPVMVSVSFKPNCSDDFIARTNVEGELISNDFDDCANSDGSHEFLQKTCLRRSHSLGNFEDRERASSGGDVTEDNVVWDCKCAYRDMEKIIDVYPEGLEVFEMKFYGHRDHSAKEPLNQSSEQDHQDYLSSLGTNEQTVEDHHDDPNEKSSEENVCSREISLRAHPRLSKSRSLSSLETYNAIDVIFDLESIGFTKSKSAGNLLSMKYKRDLSAVCHESHYSRLQLDINESEKQLSAFPEAFDEVYALSDSSAGSNEIGHRNTDTSYNDEHECNQLAKTEGSPSYANSMQIGFLSNEDVEFHCVPDQERGKEICYQIPKEDQSDYGSDCSRYDGEPSSWMPAETDDADCGKKLPEKDSSVEYESQLTNKEYCDKRILEWISQIDIQSDNIVEEVGENSKSVHIKHPNKSASLMVNKRFEARSIPGMEVAYSYISTLNPASSSARMANMGLFAIPSLSAFVGLKVLNLSGNSIERITSGSLPKGLHALNLSKNNIPGIEGLRELARLRILDLSHNRISRIGHGLSACSSLRELYLAGNKIGEVEGLHRLLKLNILDLSSNKIATSKGLGQLAANYASLQVINLESNPAQKNIGDEQLKKCLLKILPNLVSYNKKAIRTIGSKEVSVNRSARSQSSHLSDRTLRSEHKRSLRTASSHRPSLSRAQSGNALTYLLKSSKSRHRRPAPPVVSKQTDEVPKSGLKLTK